MPKTKDDLWVGTALIALVKVAEQQPYLAADDVWPKINITSKAPSLMGYVFKVAKERGWIKLHVHPYTDDYVYRRSKYRKHHGRPIPVWESLLIEQERHDNHDTQEPRPTPEGE